MPKLARLTASSRSSSHVGGVDNRSSYIGFTNAITLILALALPSVLSGPDDVPRTSAGMFTISYSLAMVLSVVSGWLWDLTRSPLAGFAPVAACGLVIIVLASTVRHAGRHPAAPN